MRRLLIFYILSLSITGLHGQTAPPRYKEFIKKGDSLYKAKDYFHSGMAYSEAFKSFDWKGFPDDRYDAGCSWALAGIPDSAFFQFYRIATKVNWKDYDRIIADSDLVGLHKDARWKDLTALIKQNKDKAEANLNRPLMAQLDSLYKDDQTYRRQLDSVEKHYKWDSEERKAHWRLIAEKDSINIIRLEKILAQYGWLGADVVGEQGNSTLFLVVQHSNLEVQEKYLPMMREAVKHKKASGASLALLEDRVALRKGKMQVYGSQLLNDSSGMYVQPIEDVENVDIRRASVGLPTMENYLQYWNLHWSVEQYKKDLPKVEAIMKKRAK